MKAALPCALAAALVSQPALAQDGPQSMPELALELAYGFCPLLMNGDAQLADNPALQARGFPAAPQAGSDARFPGFALLAQTRADGELTLGGIPQSLCQVTVIGPQSEAALVTMRSAVADLALALQPDPANSGTGPQGRGTVETLVMPLPDSGVVRVQFLHTSLGNGTPMATFQIMFQEQ